MRDPSVQAWEDLAPIFALRHDRIGSAIATASDARLWEIQFASGRRILAGPDPNYENWEVSGPGFRLISRASAVAALPTFGKASRDGFSRSPVSAGLIEFRQGSS